MGLSTIRLPWRISKSRNFHRSPQTRLRRLRFTLNKSVTPSPSRMPQSRWSFHRIYWYFRKVSHRFSSRIRDLISTPPKPNRCPKQVVESWIQPVKQFPSPISRFPSRLLEDCRLLEKIRIRGPIDWIWLYKSRLIPLKRLFSTSMMIFLFLKRSASGSGSQLRYYLLSNLLRCPNR